MNKKVLQKCLDELSKTTPDISYVRGMLETSLDMLGGAEPTHILSTAGLNPINAPLEQIIPSIKTEEELLADSYARGPIGKITA